MSNYYFAAASERSYIRISTEQGLTGNNVYFTTQDNIGYLWIATETGLSRFDGNTFSIPGQTSKSETRNVHFKSNIDCTGRGGIFSQELIDTFCMQSCAEPAFHHLSTLF